MMVYYWIGIDCRTNDLTETLEINNIINGVTA